MNEQQKWRTRAGVAEHAEARPSPEERANVAAFDDALKALGASSSEAQPRRWITRIGALLRQVRAQREVGQEIVAEKAQVTQPYLSRLENGGVPKRGPTIDVLFRCAEAMGCDIEVSMRSKTNGELLGRVSSADLALTGLELSKETPLKVEVSTPTMRRPPRPLHPDERHMVNLIFKRGANRQKAVVWVATQAREGRLSFKKTSLDEKGSSVASAIKQYIAPRGRVHAGQVGKTNTGAAAEPQTVNVGEGDVVVITST